MLIESVRVQNFRSVLDGTIPCDELTALVGPNGAGKSTFLQALDLFYRSSAKVGVEDFYNSDTALEIVVSVSFYCLTDEAMEFFSSYVQGDRLTVDRVFKWNEGNGSGTYHGARLQNSEFESIRVGILVKDRGSTAKGEYNAIRGKPKYSSLPNWTAVGAVGPALIKWEDDNPAECTPQRDAGNFFGFTGVGRGYLGKFTQFLFIPAVRDASDDAAEGRGSVFTQLMELVVRNTVANKEAFQKLQDETQRRYKEVMQPENHPELSGLSSDLSEALQFFVPNASVELRWLPLDQIKIEMPKADVKLVEDNYPTAVHRTGHGLQRAFILSMLQYLAMAKSANKGSATDDVATTPPMAESSATDDVATTPPVAEGSATDDIATIPPAEQDPASEFTLANLVLAIEEPELYQHPNRQRHLAKIFLKLALETTPGVAGRTQIIYATHSPLFVGLDRFNQIRRLRKVSNGDGKPLITTVVWSTLDKVAERVWEADGKKGPKFTGDTLTYRLQSIMTPWVNEGFFADAVALVEGEDDYAAIIGMARAMKCDLESIGVSVIPVSGKSSLDRPAIIFSEFGIPTFILWDSDSDSKSTAGACPNCGRSFDRKPDPADNHRLLRIVGAREEDWPVHLEPHFCCFERDLESTLKFEIGEDLFDQLLGECQEEFSFAKRRHALKNPSVIATIIERAQNQGKTSKTLEEVVNKILSLARASTEKTATS